MIEAVTFSVLPKLVTMTQVMTMDSEPRKHSDYRREQGERINEDLSALFQIKKTGKNLLSQDRLRNCVN